VYQRYCRACHGPAGEGGPQGEASAAPSNLADTTWDHGSSDAAIFTVIKKGIGPDYAMEAWGDRINDTEIWNVVNYIRSLAKK
jgi:mono/diheme cytochrome c family protein